MICKYTLFLENAKTLWKREELRQVQYQVTIKNDKYFSVIYKGEL